MNKTIRIARKSIWTMLALIVALAVLTIIVGIAGMKEVEKTKTTYERMMSCQSAKYEAKITELEAELIKASSAVNEAYSTGFDTAVYNAIPLGYDAENNFQIQFLDQIENYSCSCEFCMHEQEEAEMVEEVKTVEKLEDSDIFELTAYCPCSKCCGDWADGITATGVYAQANHTIAVDPKVIPYGSHVLINGNEYVAEDCGGAIKGNRIDVYFDTHEEAIQFGRKKAEVILLN